MNNLGAAITGTGFMGPAHTEALRRLGVKVVGILGSSAEKSCRAAATLGIPKGYSNYDELLADDEVDVVHVASPNRVHFDQASRALQAGKHVLCEKPLAMTTEESARLVELAQNSGQVAGVNYNIRFYPLNLEARERVRRGDLGQIHSVFGGYVQDWLLYPTDYNWRVLVAEGGALRAVADIGTHWLDLVQTITGLQVEAVFADLQTVYPTRQRPQGEVETFSGKVQPVEAGKVQPVEAGKVQPVEAGKVQPVEAGKVQPVEASESIDIKTEDQGAVLLRFKGGARGSMWVSQMTAGRKNSLRYEIAGSEGSLAWNGESPNDLWLGHRNKPNEVLIRDPGLVSEAVRQYISYPGGHNEGYDDTFKQCFKAFYNYITAGDFSAPKPFPTFADGHQEIVICDAILKSHQEGKWVKVG